MRDEGASAAECVERFDAHEIADQAEALEQTLAFRVSVPAVPGAGQRKAAMLESLHEDKPSLLDRLVSSPARTAAVGLVAVFALGIATVGAANPGGLRDTVGEALGLVTPEGECAGVLSEQVEVCGWGYNGDGQLGLGDVDDETTAQPVPQLEGVTAIAAGGATRWLCSRTALCWRGGGTARASWVTSVRYARTRAAARRWRWR